MTRVLIVEDDALVGEGIASLLTRNGLDVVAITRSVLTAMACARSRVPDVILADVMLDGEPGGFELPGLLGREGLEIPVILLSGYPMPYFIERSRQAGARGFLPKSANLEQLIAAIEGAVAGMESFPARDRRALRAPTYRELDVLALVATGLSHKEAAGRLGISSRTVDGHVQRMHERYDVDSSGALVLLALRMGWIAPLATSNSEHSSHRAPEHPNGA